MVHRALQGYLMGNVDRARRQYSFSDLAEIGEHLSVTEEAAENAEQELKTILVLYLLRNRVGEELDGVIVSLNAFGAAAHLPQYGVEGLIPREALGPDYWQFDEQSQCLVGRQTGAILRLAQPIRVRIIDVHPAAGQLDLAPATELIVRMPQQVQQRAGRKHVPKHYRGRKNR
jgi:ribonuclease R